MESHIEKVQLIEELRNFAEPFTTIQQASLQSLIDRIGDSQLVLLGESTHGTAEFYQMRAQITQELIKQKGFSIVAVEADWPDASIINHYVHSKKLYNVESKAFNRFPFWMWRNVEFHLFMEWLKNHNQAAGNHQQVGFYGLDLYSMYTSIQAVIHYLKQLDPHLAQIAIHHYSGLKTWKEKPYARLVANAESYYRAVYSNFVSSWNIRDQHMFETLQAILDFKENHPKAVIWKHNSHIGDASATTISKHA